MQIQRHCNYTTLHNTTLIYIALRYNCNHHYIALHDTTQHQQQQQQEQEQQTTLLILQLLQYT